MRKCLVFLFLSFFAFQTMAQNKQLLYNFDEIPQSLMLNPGQLVYHNWYVGFPVLSHISLGVGSSGIDLYDLFANNNVSFNDKLRAVVHNTSIRDEISVNQQLEILNVGYRAKQSGNFYSFGIYQELDVISYWPKDMLILGLEGNANHLNRRFNFDHIKGTADLLTVFHFGINKQWSKYLTVGARAKIYSSIINVNSTGNSGYFVTTPGQQNVYAHTFNGEIEVKTSGFQALKDESDLEDGNVGEEVMGRALLGGNLGLGVDFGFSYDLTEQWQLSASVLDFGLIVHSNAVKRYNLKGSHTTEGLEAIIPVDQTEDLFQKLVDQIEGNIPNTESEDSYITTRPVKLYGAATYSFGVPLNDDNCNCDVIQKEQVRLKYRNSVGAQLYIIKRPRGPQAALTAFYTKRLGRVLNLRATYTLDKFSATNLGFGMSIHFGKFNMYLMADNLLEYQDLAKAHSATFQFGINILSSN